MSVTFQRKEQYDINDLLQIMQILRAPGGCPWDAAQTHASIKKDFIEETYEVIEAINKADKVLLQEELGDVLMQVVFHSQIEKEQGSFDFGDVADGICKKLIERHPHVFADVSVNDTDEVLTNWDTIKRKSKHQDTFSSAMDAVPKELPALMRCNKILQKAQKSGLERTTSEKATTDFYSAADALCKATDAQREERIGQAFLALVNLARIAKIDSEEALTAATDQYIAAFKKAEAAALEKGIDMKQAAPEVLETLF